MLPLDTDPVAYRIQLDLFRRASVEQRATLARSLSSGTIQLTLRAIREANPNAAEDELAVRFVALCYGEALAERLRRRLEEHRPPRE